MRWSSPFNRFGCHRDGVIKHLKSLLVASELLLLLLLLCAHIATLACSSSLCPFQVWGVGGKFGTSAAVGVVLPPAPQMVEKQGWTYVSKPSQVLRGAHEAQSDITGIAFSKVLRCVR